MTMKEANEAIRKLVAKGYRCERFRRRPGLFGWAVKAHDDRISSIVEITVPGQVMSMVTINRP